jgi:hypothetical protein
MNRVYEDEELLIDILQMLGVDFVVQGREHDEYYVALPPV